MEEADEVEAFLCTPHKYFICNELEQIIEQI